MESAIQYYPSYSGKIKAVTLVTHGLNVKPDAMLQLVHFLTGYGSDVYLVCLAGHNSNCNIREATGERWHSEMMTGYQVAHYAALKHSVPLYFLGYSLGALLGQSMLGLSQNCPGFSKQVLLAPAIAIRRRAYLLKLLFPFGKNRMLHSYSPKEHRVNKAIPLHIYATLFTEEHKVIKAACTGLNKPTLVFIDPKDELISHKKLVQMVQQFQLSNYQIIALDSSMKDRKSKFHHLILSEASMGVQNWQMVTSQMKSFLFGDDADAF